MLKKLVRIEPLGGISVKSVIEGVILLVVRADSSWYSETDGLRLEERETGSSHVRSMLTVLLMTLKPSRPFLRLKLALEI